MTILTTIGLIALGIIFLDGDPFPWGSKRADRKEQEWAKRVAEERAKRGWGN